MTDPPLHVIQAQDAPLRQRPSLYPEPFASRMVGRQKRPLGELFGLLARRRVDDGRPVLLVREELLHEGEPRRGALLDHLDRDVRPPEPVDRLERAREAELPYGIVAMVTDYDCWHQDHDHVTVEQVIKVLNGNADNARALLKALAPLLGPKRTPSPLNIETTLDTALITAPEKRDAALVAKLDAVAGRVLRKA